MIGYAFLVIIATFVVILGSVVVGVAIWGWGQEKKAAALKSTPPVEVAIVPENA
jgi:uncharacterized membrane protein YidH (DUF202 family)